MATAQPKIKVNRDGFFIVLKAIILPIFWLIFLPRVKGRKNIPQTGGGLICGNHVTVLDAIALLLGTHRTVHYLAKKELFRGPLKYLFRNLGAIPVDRSKKGGNDAALAAARDRLDRGQLIGIFPEGTTLYKQRYELLPFKYGAVKLAYDSGVTITPLAITGRYIPLARNLTLNFGRPITVGNDLDKANAELRRAIIDLMIESRPKIAELYKEERK